MKVSRRINLNNYQASIELEKIRKQELELITTAKRQAYYYKSASIDDQRQMDRVLRGQTAAMMIDTHELLRKTNPIYTLVKD